MSHIPISYPELQVVPFSTRSGSRRYGTMPFCIVIFLLTLPRVCSFPNHFDIKSYVEIQIKCLMKRVQMNSY